MDASAVPRTGGQRFRIKTAGFRTAFAISTLQLMALRSRIDGWTTMRSWSARAATVWMASEACGGVSTMTLPALGGRYRLCHALRFRLYEFRQLGLALPIPIPG